MKRRDVIGIVSLCAALFAFTAGPVGIPAVAQQSPPAKRLAGLGRGDTGSWRVFTAILGRLGWVEGKNIAIDRRFADSSKRAAAELVALHPGLFDDAGTRIEAA